MIKAWDIPAPPNGSSCEVSHLSDPDDILLPAKPPISPPEPNPQMDRQSGRETVRPLLGHLQTPQGRPRAEHREEAGAAVGTGSDNSGSFSVDDEIPLSNVELRTTVPTEPPYDWDWPRS